MTERRYVVLTLEHAHLIAGALSREAPAFRGLPQGADEMWPKDRAELERIRDRLLHETGADMDEIVEILSKMPLCAACKIEARESNCNVLDAQKQGRRLRRLLERARGERGQEGS